MTTKDIIKRFDEDFTDISHIGCNDITCSTIKLKIKDFILKALAEQKELPMGASQWKAHGKKYGYDKFFMEKIVKVIEDLADDCGDGMHCGCAISYATKEELLKTLK